MRKSANWWGTWGSLSRFRGMLGQAEGRSHAGVGSGSRGPPCPNGYAGSIPAPALCLFHSAQRLQSPTIMEHWMRWALMISQSRRWRKAHLLVRGGK